MPTEQPGAGLRQLRRVALLQDCNGLSDGHLLDCFAHDRIVLALDFSKRLAVGVSFV